MTADGGHLHLDVNMCWLYAYVNTSTGVFLKLDIGLSISVFLGVILRNTGGSAI